MMRVSVYTVRRWILDGALPASKVGRGWRISERAIKAWLEQQRAGASDPHYPEDVALEGHRGLS